MHTILHYRYYSLLGLSLILTIQLNAQSPSPTNDRNYVMEHTAKEAGITSKSQLSNKDVNQVNRTIQYLDGLGRPAQTIEFSGSPNGNDIVQHSDFDEYGRQDTKYLPYVAGDDDGSFKSDAYGDLVDFYDGTTPTDKIAQDSDPWAVTILEDSPLSRTLKEGAPGTDWQPNNGADIDYNYSANIDREVIHWEVQSNGTVATGSEPYYGSGKLYKQITFDEHDNQIVEYTDFQGRTILKKVQVDNSVDDDNHEGWACTYYIYDDLGNLRVVLPPELVKQIITQDVTNYEDNGGNLLSTNTDSDVLNQSTKYYYLPSVTVTLKDGFTATTGFEIILLPFSINQGQLNRWAFQYKYDERNRMAEKKVPGSGWVYMVYDKRDRSVLTQNGNQRADNEWTFTKYDAMNRPVMTGIYTHNSGESQSNMQSYVNGEVGQGSNAWYESYTGNTSMHGYNNQSFPKNNEDASALNVLTVTYYDKYDFLNLSEFNNDFNFGNTPSGYPSNNLDTPNGQVTGSKTKNLEDDSYLKTATYYDEKYRVIQTNNSNQLGGIDKVYNLYDFVGNLTKTRLIHDDGTNTITIEERFEYDHVDRHVNHYHKINSQQEVLLVHNDYNELGELVDKKLHSTDDGSTYLQSVDHKYNIRGWLTNINNSDLSNLYSDDNGDNTDFFGMELGYNQSIDISGQQNMYNGNISAMKWSATAGGDGESERAYEFDYDNLNRLKAANPYHKTASWNAANNKTKVNNINYDYNGNIKSLDRYDYDANAMDKMSYDYGSGSNQSNQLLSVTDSGDDNNGFKDGNTNGDDYDYDDNGNLTKDLNKDITSISYNYMNLPERIDFSDSKYIEYYYDAAGIKLAKVVFDGMNEKRTDYVGNFIYEGEELQIIQHSEGRYAIPQGSSVANGEYQYYIKDHLGNTRITFTSEPDTEEQTATMESENSSYESQYFNYINNTIPEGTKNKTVGGDEVLVLDTTYNVGASYRREVMPGDEIEISVWSAYESSTNYSSTYGQTSMINVIAAAFGGVPGDPGEAGVIYDGIEAAIGAMGLGGSQGSTEPAAYLNYILFDKNYNYLQGGFVSTVGSNQGSMQQFNINDIEVEQPGILFVYVSNESSGTNKQIWFDELVISTSQSIIQVEEYYPFGFSIAEFSTTRENIVDQNFKYNGKEFQDDFDLNWYDYGARMYMSEIGRFNQIDPHSEKYHSTTPYNYAFNSPVLIVDPNGLDGVIYIQVLTDEDGNPSVSKEKVEKAVKQINKTFADLNIDLKAEAHYSNEIQSKSDFYNRDGNHKSDSYVLVGGQEQIKKANNEAGQKGWTKVDDYDSFKGVNGRASSKDNLSVINTTNVKQESSWEDYTSIDKELSQYIMHETGHPKFIEHHKNRNDFGYTNSALGHISGTIMDEKPLSNHKHDNWMIKKLQSIHGKVKYSRGDYKYRPPHKTHKP